MAENVNIVPRVRALHILEPTEAGFEKKAICDPGLTSNGNGIAGDLAGNGSAKEKLKQLNVDDMIRRLLDVGYTGKVSKSLCLICLAARDVFLGQPTLVELSPPVKIVGDVHGQYSDLIRLFEMCVPSCC